MSVHLPQMELDFDMPKESTEFATVIRIGMDSQTND